MRARLRSSLITALLLAACSSGERGDPPVQLTPSPSTKLADVEAKAKAKAEAEAEQPGEVASSETGELEDAVIEIEGPETKRGHNVVPVVAISPVPASVTWTERERIDDPGIELSWVASGVLGRSNKGVYALEGEHLKLQAGLTLPASPLLGHWPDDLWYVESKPSTTGTADDGEPQLEYTLYKLDRDRQWVAYEYRSKKQRWIGDALAVRKGWLAGVLFRNGSSLARIGSSKSAPKVGVRMGKLVLDTFEVNSGKLYTITRREDTIYVQLTCFTRTCVDENAKKLPFGTEWSFATQVPRQRNSLSVLTAVKLDGVVSHQLLHYEIGGWSLETLVHEPRGLWANADGGLWMLTRDELRYRAGPGKWYAIALPEGLSKVSVAVSTDLRQLYVAGKQGGQTVWFSTPAVIAELPASESEH